MPSAPRSMLAAPNSITVPPARSAGTARCSRTSGPTWRTGRRAVFSRAWSRARHHDIPAKVALGHAGAEELVAPGSPTDQVWGLRDAPDNAGPAIAGTA